MLKTWSFWKTFFTSYPALVTGIWLFVEIYTHYESDLIKRILGSNWWIFYFIVPLFISLLYAVWIHSIEERQAESLDQHNRRVMLDHVENFWVKGILEKSLYGAALLELGIKEDPAAVNYPWTIKRERTNEPLPAGKSMFEIFKEIGLGRSLLILGAPGSGKTTMLLDLARQLIERARNDETEPVPVVFNLASWTEKQTITNWLADQLNMVYYVPKKTALKWVSENQMLLLLDGLDEVNKESRTKCVEAINMFRTEHGLTSLAICSRLEEYTSLLPKLSLEGAITLQPLTAEQIDAYFDRFGKSLVGAKQFIKEDGALQELVQTPLMLSIVSLAYKNIQVKELISLKNKGDQRKHLFDAYINRMFERPTRIANSPFTKPQTLHYLNWLARKMILHNIITYQIESMQPSWLKDDNQRRSYKGFAGLSAGLIFGLIGGLIVGLIFELIGGLRTGLIAGLGVGLIVGLIFGLIVGLSGNKTIYMVDMLGWSWKEARSRLSAGLVFGLIGGLIFELIGGLSAGLSAGLIFGLGVGLIRGLGVYQIEETTYPGQRLKRTFFNGLIAFILIGLIVGLIVGLIYGLSAGLIYGLSAGLSAGLIFGLIGGLIVGLSAGYPYGFKSLIQHFTLRYFMIKDGFLPRRRLIPFLEYAVDLIFMRRVGGGYIFVHRLIMEHFAEMDV